MMRCVSLAFCTRGARLTLAAGSLRRTIPARFGKVNRLRPRLCECGHSHKQDIAAALLCPVRYDAAVPETLLSRKTPLSDEELLGNLIAFDSTSYRSNKPIVEFIGDYLAGPGIETIRNASEDGSKENIIAIAGPQAIDDHPRDGLILCGHLDTVPADEPDWASDPFTLTKRDGRFIARGSADMKGFDALAINLLRSIDASRLQAPLVLLLTYDEELGSLGAKRLVETWPDDRPLPRSAIIGEPTSLEAVRMHKGHLKMRITLRGKAAHSGSPHLGANAIEPAWEVLCGLAEMRKHLQAKRTTTSHFFPEVPFSVVTAARIAGGDALNVIPDTCEIDIGIRLLPGQVSEAAITMVEGITRSITLPTGVSIDVTVLGDNPPLLTEDDAPIHRALCNVLQQRESRGVSFASDAGWLSTLGIDCVLFGPGTIEVAHKPNESLPIDEFVRARQHLEHIINTQCGDG